MRSLLFRGALACALLLGFVVAAAAADDRLRDIRVTGNRRIETQTILQKLRLRAGHPYDAEKADESLKALFATEWLRDVTFDRKGSVLTVTVVENPVVGRVVFEGNREVSAETLGKAITLKRGDPLTATRIKTAVQAILGAYRSQGFYAAQADAKTIERGQGPADVVFEIREGAQSKVAALNFRGNRAFSDDELRSVVTTKETGLFDFLKSSVVYDDQRLMLDRELIRRHYLRNGYADMRVVSAVADTDGAAFFITFTLDEGPRYTLSSVGVDATVEGLNAQEARQRVAAKPGDIYNAEQGEKTVEALTKFAAERGFPFAQVRARLTRDPVTQTVAVVYAIEQGQRLYIERIDVTGNSQTQLPVILRELRFAEGDAYNQVMVDAARERLMRLGFFKSVTMTKAPGSAPDRVKLSIAVEEAPTGELGFTTGYSSNEGVIGEVSYTERNWMGTGQYLQLKVNGSLVSGGFSLGWTEPHFLDRNMSFGVNVFARNSDYTAGSGYTVAGYKDLRYGGSAQLGLPLTDTLSIAPRYTLSWDRVYNLDRTASLAVRQIEGTAITSAVGYSLIYDTRDNRRKPSRGFYFSGTQDLAGAGGTVNYLRSTADFRAYYPVTPDIVLAGRTVGGTIGGWDGQGVRIADAFYRGSDTIRGFQSGGLGPREAATGNALGGTTYYAASAEVRLPIPLLRWDLGLGVSVFTDAGSLFGTDAQRFAAAYVAKNGGANTLAVQNSSIVRSSAGVSLTWDSPIGPLRSDFTKVITKAPSDKTQTFGFGAGLW
jgi:outer membrane protein insertion porin family